MYTVLLSGGSGKRLWPLSNDLRSKQYIKLLSYERDDGGRCSMVQRVWAQLEESGLAGRSVICASTGQVEIIQSQLGDVPIAIEPSRRDTFPAVALSCAYLVDKSGAKREDIVCIMPVDPFVESTYFQTLRKLEGVLEESKADIALMGAKPTYASEKYGYIIPDEQQGSCFSVKGFREKPTAGIAQHLIKQGAYWNCGVFCFRLGTVLDRLADYGVSEKYDDLFEGYDNLPKISFDYEILEKARNLVVIPYSGIWKDLGTWNTLTEEMMDTSFGKARMSASCSNTHVINELNIPIVTIGTKDLVVAASYDGILVSDKPESSTVKDVLKDIQERPLYEERRWGTLKTLDYDGKKEHNASLTKKVIVFKGMSSSNHYHELDDEIWVVIRGKAEVIIEGEPLTLAKGSSIHIKKGQRHAVSAIEEFEYIEIHLGENLQEIDIQDYV
jgi:mannose-1-phosphate guanylyltransferase